MFHTMLEPPRMGHRVGIVLAGVGGTGSQVLNGLARMDHALRALGGVGLFVVAMDDDVVSESNLGRQVFATGDLGRPKAGVLVTRINRYFGLDWEAWPVPLSAKTLQEKSTGYDSPLNYMEVLITCVDSGAARVEIASAVQRHMNISYWLDFGNRRADGQVILGTFSQRRRQDVPPGSEDVAWLPHVLDLFPGLGQADEPDEPSCSMAEALERQDLFVNSILADCGLNILWKLLKDGRVDMHGAFVNLSTLTAAPLRVDPQQWESFGWKQPRQ